MPRKRMIIMGAAGRDFHNFNVLYRDDDRYDVVAFTAAQIPNIAGRKYPASLAGKLYPKGIPIHEEKDLEGLIRRHAVEEVVFSYSDVSYRRVMSLGSRASAAAAPCPWDQGTLSLGASVRGGLARGRSAAPPGGG